MREIKFRAQNRETKEWHYGGTKPYYGDRPFTIMYLSAFWEAWQNGRFDHVGQFSGLYDKNGKEIYEGDIVRPAKSSIVNKVCCEDGQFVLNWSDNHTNMRLGQNLADIHEVIGNIYDNLDLLS